MSWKLNRVSLSQRHVLMIHHPMGRQAIPVPLRGAEAIQCACCVAHAGDGSLKRFPHQRELADPVHSNLRLPFGLSHPQSTADSDAPHNNTRCRPGSHARTAPQMQALRSPLVYEPSEEADLATAAPLARSRLRDRGRRLRARCRLGSQLRGLSWGAIWAV